MDSALQIQTRQFRFNIRHVLILIAIAVSVFLLSNLLTAKHIAEKSVDFGLEDISEIAEEIYSSGVLSDAVGNLPVDASLIAKMTEEIERILAKTTDYPGCEVYYLQARISGNFPVLGYGNEIFGFEFLNIGEVWKVGQTCNGEDGRYPTSTYFKTKDGAITMTEDFLEYKYIYRGYYRKCLILEKMLIYTYPLWSGHPDLIKPPGCKIFR